MKGNFDFLERLLIAWFDLYVSEAQILVCLILTFSLAVALLAVALAVEIKLAAKRPFNDKFN